VTDSDLLVLAAWYRHWRLAQNTSVICKFHMLSYCQAWLVLHSGECNWLFRIIHNLVLSPIES